MQKDENDIELQVQQLYVICLFNFLGFSTIAAEIKVIYYGQSNSLDYFSQNAVFFNTIFCFYFESNSMLILMSAVI